MNLIPGEFAPAGVNCTLVLGLYRNSAGKATVLYLQCFGDGSIRFLEDDNRYLAEQQLQRHKCPECGLESASCREDCGRLGP